MKTFRGSSVISKSESFCRNCWLGMRTALIPAVKIVFKILRLHIKNYSNIKCSVFTYDLFLLNEHLEWATLFLSYSVFLPITSELISNPSFSVRVIIGFFSPS